MSIDNQEQLVILSDGARWINKLAQTQYPKARLILDWWHLKRRAWPTVRGLPYDGLSAQDGRDWSRQWIDRLWRGQVTETLKSIFIGRIVLFSVALAPLSKGLIQETSRSLVTRFEDTAVIEKSTDHI